MNNRLLLGGAGLGLVGALVIAVVFGSATGTSASDLPEPSALPTTSSGMPPASADETVPPPTRVDPPDAATAEAAATPDASDETHQQKRDRMLDPDEQDRRDRLRDEHYERLVAGTKSRFVEVARKQNIDPELADGAALKLENYMRDSRATRDAVRTGELTRDEAKDELLNMKNELENDLVAVFGEDGYRELRSAVPGKW